jgi:hypothetical protein
MTKYAEKKKEELSLCLTSENLPQIDIPPSIKLLSLSTPTITSLSPKERTLTCSVPVFAEVSPTKQPLLPKSRKNISFRKFQPVEIVPGARNDDSLLFSSYIDGGTFTTTFVCHFCYDDYTFKAANTLRTHIETVHRKEMHHKLKFKPIFEPIFETMSY